MSDKGKTLSAKILNDVDKDVISIGEVYKGVCDAGMAPSTTTIVSKDLKGFGDDYFNTDWVMLVLYNDNSHGAAPEGEVRDITDYVSATGTFTAVAFSANIEPDDVVMVAYTKHYQFATSAELCDTSGPGNVQIDDVGTYNIGIYDVGNVVPTAAEIAAGNYQIDRLRAGVLTNIVASVAASKADGRIYAAETFDAGSGWAAGDLVLVTFSGGSIGVTGVTTVLPNKYFWTRIVTEALPSAEITGSYNLPNDVAENTAIEITTTDRRRLDSVWLDLNTLVQDVTIKVYHKIDGANYRQYDEFSWGTAEEDGVLITDISINNDWKLTITSTVAQGGIKAIPYNVIYSPMEA